MSAFPPPPAPPESLFDVEIGVDLAPEGAREKVIARIPRLKDSPLLTGPIEIKANAAWVHLDVTRDEYRSLRGQGIGVYETDRSQGFVPEAQLRPAALQ